MADEQVAAGQTGQAPQIAGLAFVFPGQGSQAVGMLDALADEFSSVHDTLAEASAALGYDIGALIHADANDKLGQTEFTQPAILVTSVAIWRVWQELGGADPAMMAGHSLGEYSALVCAGALSLADGVTLVRDRGTLMQQAVPEGAGAMAAILGLSDEQILDCCANVPGEVAPANYNAPGQVVVAGSAAAVAQAIEACKEAGAKRALPVAMSVPSHSKLLRDAADKLAQRLSAVELKMPRMPIVHNVDATIATSTQEIAEKLKAQLHNPVRWTQCAETLAANKIDQIAERGPGKVLCGLQKRINKSISATALNSAAALAQLLSQDAGI